MVAYILQMLFFALSLFSVVVMVIMILKDMKATKKQWWALLLPILLLFMAIAYRFDWTTNINNDMARYVLDFQAMKHAGFDYEFRFADEFSWLWRVLAYVFCHFHDYHWFPVFAVAVEFGIFFHILADSAEENSLAALDILLLLLLRLAFLPLIISVAAPRNTLAYAVFALGVYRYYKYGLKDLRVYFYILAGVLIHTTVLFGVVIFLLALLCQKNRLLILLFPLLGLLFSTVIAPILENSSSEYLRYFVERWDMYVEDPNTYDGIKTGRIMYGLLPMLLLLSYWFLSKNTSHRKGRTSYLIANMAVTVGVSAMMPSLFLRLCYPTSILMPVFWSEAKTTSWISARSGIYFWIILIVITAILFVSTQGSWMIQIYWFFEV